jgi:arylsulfatase A-like enzyme
MFLHLWDVHSKFHRLPYEAPRPFRDAFCPDYDGEYNGCDHRGRCASELLSDMSRGLAPIPTETSDIDRMICLYDGAIRFVDQELGRLFSALRDFRLYDKSVVAVIADHGEAFFEHGLPLHPNLYDEVLRVPLIIRTPHGGRGQRVDGLVRAIDLVPTLLELAGLQAHQHAQGSSIAGAVLRNEDPAPASVFAVSPNGGAIAIRTHRWKYIISRHGSGTEQQTSEELYDLFRDPGEKQNLQEGSPINGAPALRAALVEQEQSSRLLNEELLAGYQATALTIPAAALERLRALGYADWTE